MIYCDIPYDCTKECYGVKFDRLAFLDWADAQEAPIVVSEYNIDDPRFEVLAERQKKQLMQGSKYQKNVTERLCVPKRQAERIRSMLHELRT